MGKVRLWLHVSNLLIDRGGRRNVAHERSILQQYSYKIVWCFGGDAVAFGMKLDAQLCRVDDHA